MRRGEDLSTPRRRRRLTIHYDPEAFGEFSEAIARTIGTARFLVWQTVVCILWIAANSPKNNPLHFDGDQLQLLTLALSLQAAYAAPLILLAQSRQEDRDRVQTELDRVMLERTKTEAEYLAREIAGIRIALSDVVTTDDLTSQLGHLTKAIERIERRLDAAD